MPGETILPVEHYPDEFFTTRYFMHDSNGNSRPIFYTDANPAVGGRGRSYVVDAATIGIYGTAVGGTATLEVVYLPAGTAPTTANFNGGTAVSVASGNIDTTDTTVQMVVNTANNTIPPGCWVGIKLTAGGGTLTNLRGALQVRLRSRLK
jgi:hypothetical protein